MKTTETRFSIVREVGFDYARGNSLYLMLFQEGDQFGIRIDSRENNVGMKMAKSLEQAEAMMMQISRRIREYDGYYTAYSALTIAFGVRTVRETMFLVAVLGGKEWEFLQIVRLSRIYRLEPFRQTMDSICLDGECELTIPVKFIGARIPAGCFQQVGTGGRFTFRLDQDYLLE
jgi:hypothetical protein